ncbi:hypothetical protein PFICI_07078 [Pestalotiopsis fici W106-1]|uniref:Uncharacterized protein n=1 Tax=Pestalotiopsis fici (strain W106-1 / CGMCC3.15140) TaxID=1229662 RepID=W3XA75_PESFW|nr:uncharacterized protein PFICI_07078 [Pestalotiopsis fici W106-1]ETS82076.1 hypothetical protein PFICI_07078 [Pestalotiopsis fici W106-1]
MVKPRDYIKREPLDELPPQNVTTIDRALVKPTREDSGSSSPLGSTPTSARERQLQPDGRQRQDHCRIKEENGRTQQVRQGGNATPVKMESGTQALNSRAPFQSRIKSEPNTPHIKSEPSSSRATTTRSAPRAAPACLNCRAKIKIRCDKCQAAGYCRQSCLEADAQRHFDFCVGGVYEGQQDLGPDVWLASRSTSPEPAATASTQKRSCLNCSSSSKLLSPCSCCFRVFYCSLHCEQIDRPRHRASIAGGVSDPGAGTNNTHRDVRSSNLGSERETDESSSIEPDYDGAGLVVNSDIGLEHDTGQSGLQPWTNNPDTVRLIEHLASLPDIDVPPAGRQRTPHALACELQPHQKVGLTWLMRQEKSIHRGGILADTMGLGKTIQALALILAHPSKDQAHKTTLIVAPVSLQRQWKTEIEDKIRPGHKLKTIIIDGRKRKTVTMASLLSHDIVLTSYGTILSEYSPRKGASNKKLITAALYHRIILDEAHNIKNDRSRTSEAITSLRARYKLCLTATPLMNNVRELYSLVRFLRISPYDEWAEFNQTFVKPTSSRSDFERQPAMRALHTFLQSILLQRTANSRIDGHPVLRLPPLIHETSTMEFDDDQRRDYSAVEQRMRDKFQGYVESNTVLKNYCNVLVMILRLRQFCCHPQLITDHGIPDGIRLKPREMITLALKLDEAVVESIKQLEALQCSLCNQTTENPVIIHPCGHFLCSVCFTGYVYVQEAAQIADDGEDEDYPLCPSNSCGEIVDPRKVLCYSHFLTAYGLDNEGGADEELAEEYLSTEMSDDSEVDEHGNVRGFVASDEDESSASEEESHLDNLAQAGPSVSLEPIESINSDSDSDESLPELGVLLRRTSPGALPFRKRARSSMGNSRANTEAENSADIFAKRNNFLDRHMETLSAAKSKKSKTSGSNGSHSFTSQRQKSSRFGYSDDESLDETEESSRKRKRSHGKGIARGEEPASRRLTASNNNKGKKTFVSLADLKAESNKNAAAKEKYLAKLNQEYEPSVKTEEVMRILGDITKNKPGEKTLVFSVFTSFLDILEKPMRDERYNFRRYDGSMARRAREVAVHDFMKRPEVKVMLIGLRAGNAGLNLQAASNVIILDPFWNPSIEDQAVGRAHRFPQNKPVTVYRVLINETIEDRILQLQEVKRELVGQVLDNQAAGSMSRLSIRELASLFGLSLPQRSRRGLAGPLDG